MRERRETRLQELGVEDCLELLATHDFGRLAVRAAHGSPIIRPVTYAFDRPSQSVVFRTGPGSKLHAIVGSVYVAFEIDGIDGSARTGWSVIVRGIAAQVTSATEIAGLKRLNLEPWAPGEKPHWMRVRAWTVSGRRIALA